MDGKQKLFLVIFGMVLVAAAVFYGFNVMNFGQISPEEVTVTERSTEEEFTQTDVNAEKEYVNVFFIGQNENREEVYKAVKREYDPDIDGTKFKFAMESLIAGPKPNERDKGVYTEIPAGTNIIAIRELPDKAIIDLSMDFEAGGGTDSLYKRLYQVIKTANRNTGLPVYLYIDGQKAEVIGGEGIMITQPLNDRSLDG